MPTDDGGRIVATLAAAAAGVLSLQCAATLPAAPGAWLAACGAALLAMGWRGTRARVATTRLHALAPLAWLACAFGAGYCYAAWRAEVRLADALPGRFEGVELALVGVVDDLPQPLDHSVRFALAVESVDTPGAVVPGRLSLAWYAPAPGPGPAELPAPVVHAGERWRLHVKLKRPHGYVNPAGFDLEAWLLEHNLRATGVVTSASEASRLDAFAGRFTDHVQRMRERIRARIVTALPDAPYAGVLVALTIGDQRAIPEAQWLVFNRTGVSHLISISGLHVTAFATLAGALVFGGVRRFTPVTTRLPARKVAVAVGALLATGYVLLAGAEVPALRTLAMLVVAATGLWLGRPGTASCVWLWSLVAVLVLDPWAGVAPGFWLSFGAVGLLLYVGTGRIDEAPAVGVLQRGSRVLRQAAATQWAITLGLVPGTLALFGQVSLVSALANAVAIPAVTMLVVPLCLAGIVLPVEAVWLAAHALLALLMLLLETMAAWPVATWSSHAPLPWTLVAGLGGIALVMAPRGVPGRWLGFAWLMPLLVVMPPRPVPGTVRITALDVGQGLAVFVETATHAVLYDTGPRLTETTDAGGRLVVPVLRAEGIRRLDAMVVSHADTDHSGGALSVLASVPTGTLWSSLPAEHPIVMRAEVRGHAIRCESGQSWTFDGVQFDVLHPPAGHYADPGIKTNDRSCVLRIAAGGSVALLTGDIEARSEALMVRTDVAALRADVVVVPHHGSRTSSTPAFVAAVAPAIAIVTAGYRNRFGHPRADVVARWRSAAAEVHRTDDEGALTVTLGGPVAPSASAARTSAARYWRDMPPPRP